ncbi:MAG: SDR family oxidoreductase [Gemmatimonadota bacterium]|jgi:3-oxoacyl-[acyl-carrier protein] reductase
MNLDGRRAVITGGSTGIGRSVASRLAAAGCRIALCARTRETLEAAADELRDGGAEVLVIPADVSDGADVLRLRDEVEGAWGGADILVNNAGIGIFGNVLDLDTDDFDAVFAVNVRGVFLCSRAFAPGMVEREDGVIVNVASLAGKNTFAGGAVYAASKHAVMGMSKSMMLDLRPHNVRVLTVCPGTVYTPFFDAVDQFDPDEAKALQADDVAEMIEHVVRMSDRATISEFEIRPVNP